MRDMLWAVLAVAVGTVLIVGVPFTIVSQGNSRRERSADSAACARMCYPTRVLQCGPVRDEAWQQPKRLAVCLAPEGVRAVTE